VTAYIVMNIKRNNTMFGNMLNHMTEVAMRANSLIGMTFIAHSFAITMGYTDLHNALVQSLWIVGVILMAKETFEN